MKTLLKNCRIINPSGSLPFIENGYILLEDDYIIETAAGTVPDVEGNNLDLKGKTVLPGMINAHAHLYSSLATGMPFPSANPKNFTEILEQVWWLLDLALDQDSVKASFEAGLLDHLRHGVTTIIDHHSSPNFSTGSLDLLAQAGQKIGLRVSGAFEITDRNAQDKFEQGLAVNLEFHRKYEKHEFIRPLIGLHASFTLSDDSLKQIKAALEKEKNWGVHIHVAEDKADHEDALIRGYDSPLQRLDSFGLLNENSLVIHGVHFLKADQKILKNRKIMLVHNPSSNANNRVGLSDGNMLKTTGAGLGTDGMQGNMLKEAKEGTLIRSSHLPGAGEGLDYLELLFKNNPQIASRLFSGKIGRLDAGYKADLAVFDYHPRTVLNSLNWRGHVLFALELPCHVMSSGTFRILDYKFTEISARKILESARIQGEVLWEKMKEIEGKK